MTVRKRHHQTAIAAAQAGRMRAALTGKRPIRRRLAAMLPLAALLAGCGGSLNDQLGQSAWVAPSKYQYHDCLQAQAADRGFAARQKEMEELMTRASRGPGGDVINTMVYRSEYQQVLGERKEIGVVLERKQCSLDSKRSSDRRIF